MFKVGDRVRIVKNTSTNTDYDKYVGGTYKIKRVYSSEPDKYELDNDGELLVWSDEELEPAYQSNPNSMSSLKERVKALIKTEPEKSLHKAGFADINDDLTEEGKAILDDIIFEEHKLKLAEVAKKIIAQDKKK